MVNLGIERFLADSALAKSCGRTGLICNQASVTRDYLHIADLMYHLNSCDLRSLFGPQHGIRGDVQDNMVETGHSEDPQTGLPVYSLYSETREPTEKMLDGLDTIVFDLQDIGSRVYTFIYTMANAMKACARDGKRFVVCDRPNPIGGLEVEGSCLERGHESFVGMFPIPMRHGLTVGELALLFNSEYGIGCDLTVVEMDGWSREMYYEDTGCSWVNPSPNIPTVESTVVFPGTVFFEGTCASEGRGTTMPFEQVGAPYINPDRLANELNALEMSGVYFRPAVFLPTFQKHSGEACGGVFIHVTERAAFRPVKAGLAIISEIMRQYPDEFAWKKPPYEYEFERVPFDVISGNTSLRADLGSGKFIDTIADAWSPDEAAFRALRKDYLLY